MAELFATSLDAEVFAAVRTGRAKPKGGPLKAPWYTQDPDAPKPAGKSGQALWDAIDRMSSNRRH